MSSYSVDNIDLTLVEEEENTIPSHGDPIGADDDTDSIYLDSINEAAAENPFDARPQQSQNSNRFNRQQQQYHNDTNSFDNSVSGEDTDYASSSDYSNLSSLPTHQADLATMPSRRRTRHDTTRNNSRRNGKGSGGTSLRFSLQLSNVSRLFNTNFRTRLGFDTSKTPTEAFSSSNANRRGNGGHENDTDQLLMPPVRYLDQNEYADEVFTSETDTEAEKTLERIRSLGGNELSGDDSDTISMHAGAFTKKHQRAIISAPKPEKFIIWSLLIFLVILLGSFHAAMFCVHIIPEKNIHPEGVRFESLTLAPDWGPNANYTLRHGFGIVGDQMRYENEWVWATVQRVFLGMFSSRGVIDAIVMFALEVHAFFHMNLSPYSIKVWRRFGHAWPVIAVATSIAMFLLGNLLGHGLSVICLWDEITVGTFPGSLTLYAASLLCYLSIMKRNGFGWSGILQRIRRKDRAEKRRRDRLTPNPYATGPATPTRDVPLQSMSDRWKADDMRSHASSPVERTPPRKGDSARKLLRSASPGEDERSIAAEDSPQPQQGINLFPFKEGGTISFVPDSPLGVPHSDESSEEPQFAETADYRTIALEPALGEESPSPKRPSKPTFMQRIRAFALYCRGLFYGAMFTVQILFWLIVPVFIPICSAFAVWGGFICGILCGIVLVQISSSIAGNSLAAGKNRAKMLRGGSSAAAGAASWKAPLVQLFNLVTCGMMPVLGLLAWAAALVVIFLLRSNPQENYTVEGFRYFGRSIQFWEELYDPWYN